MAQETGKVSNRLIVAFFMLLLAVSAYLLFNSYQNVKNIHIQAKTALGEHQVKNRLLTQMYGAARERSVLLLRMYAEKDPFELDELNQEMSKHARDFIRARQQLMAMELTEQEASILAKQNQATRVNAPLQNHVAELFIEERREEAEQLLFDEAIPNQTAILKLIGEVLASYEQNSIDAADSIDSTFLQAGKDFRILAIALLGTSAIFILFIIHLSGREQSRLGQMLTEQQRISEQLDKSTEKLSYQASHDPLTGLINRREFENRLRQLIERSEEGKTHVVFYLDLDQFKIVNDSCGHHAGDELLREVAILMKSYIRSSDVLARLGGDEFGLILEYCELNLAEKIASSIIEAVNDFRFRWETKTFRIGVSIGIVRVDDSRNDLSEILRQIDAACYAAKDAGRNRYHLYLESDEELSKRKQEMGWVVKLDRALEKDAFILYAQPIVATAQSGESVSNYEILIRMIGKDGKEVLPGAFLPAAERYNKMVSVDRWVITQAISLLSNNTEFLQQVDFCSINLSSQSLSDLNFLNHVIDLLSQHEGLANKLCFEITETVAINNLLQANRCIGILRGMGLSFALDDFGSGLSSFEYLKTLPIDYLKIDGMFVKDIVSDPIDRAMVKSIHEIGSVMGKKTVAEFVESEAILNELSIIGVDYVQGYAIGKPLPLIELIGQSEDRVDVEAASQAT